MTQDKNPQHINQQPTKGPATEDSPNLAMVAGISASFSSTSYSSPIPHPEILERYEKLVPGAAKSIMDNFSAQSEHRRALETKKIDSDTTLAKRGQLFAFTLTVLLAGVACYLVSKGQSVWAITLLVAQLGALTLVYMNGKKHQDKDLTARRDTLNINP